MGPTKIQQEKILQHSEWYLRHSWEVNTVNPRLGVASGETFHRCSPLDRGIQFSTEADSAKVTTSHPEIENSCYKADLSSWFVTHDFWGLKEWPWQGTVLLDLILRPKSMIHRPGARSTIPLLLGSGSPSQPW